MVTWRGLDSKQSGLSESTLGIRVGKCNLLSDRFKGINLKDNMVGILAA